MQQLTENFDKQFHFRAWYAYCRRLDAVRGWIWHTVAKFSLIQQNTEKWDQERQWRADDNGDASGDTNDITARSDEAIVKASFIDGNV